MSLRRRSVALPLSCLPAARTRLGLTPSDDKASVTAMLIVTDALRPELLRVMGLSALAAVVG